MANLSTRDGDDVYIIGFDFDGTITERDTVEDIARAAMEDNAMSPEGFYTAEEGAEKWKGILERYFAEFGDLMRTAGSASSSVTEYSQAERVFNRRMNEAFEGTGLLRGLEAGTLRRYARQIRLRQGARSLLTDLLSRERNPKPGRPAVDVHVVSLCWSEIFLREALQLPRHVGGSVSVHCNRIVWENDVCVDGKLLCTVQDPLDKSELMGKFAAEVSSGGARRVKTLFVGDSTGDLMALVSADVGIIMGGVRDSLQAICKSCGVRVAEATPDRSLSDLAGEARAAGTGSLIFRVESWKVLRALLENEGLVEKVRNPARVLCISGSDSGGGAGNQADIKTCSSYGAYGMSAFTALTAQNTQGVSAISGVDPEFVRAQIEAVVDDIGTDAIKTGMLATKEIVSVVADLVRSKGLANVVVDPVLVATSGDALAKEDIVEAFLKELLPVATVVTPNIPEAEILLGWGKGRIRTVEDAMEAAKELHAFGPKCVLVKGGHLPSSAGTDVLYDGEQMYQLESEMVETNNSHGTGCTLGSAIACGLAGGLDVHSSVRTAKTYLARVISESKGLDLGGQQRPQGPMHHHGLRTCGDPLLKSASNYKFYAVTDSRINARCGRDLVGAVKGAVQGGATIVQLREKGVSTSDLIDQAKAVIEVCRPLGVPVIVNDRVDVAIAVDADGVHVGEDDMPVKIARKMIGPMKIVGASVKTPEQAMRAERDGADYVGSGACYSTSTKSDSTLIGLEAVKKIKEAVDIPVVAIGGIDQKNAKSVLVETNADGLAVVSSVFDSPDVAQRCEEMRKIIDEAMRTAACGRK